MKTGIKRQFEIRIEKASETDFDGLEAGDIELTIIDKNDTSYSPAGIMALELFDWDIGFSNTVRVEYKHLKRIAKWLIKHSE